MKMKDPELLKREDVLKAVNDAIQIYKDNMISDTKRQQSNTIKDFSLILLKKISEIPIADLAKDYMHREDVAFTCACNQEGHNKTNGAYQQVCWERDIAIQQLNDLGYGFGERVPKRNS